MVRLLSEKNIEIVADAEHARLWDVLILQERDFATRSNFFLVAEALLALAFGILVALAPLYASWFCVAGLALSLLWLLAQYKTLSDLSRLSAHLRAVQFSEHYFAWREECRRFFLSHEMVAFVVPILCLIAWFLALAFTL